MGLVKRRIRGLEGFKAKEGKQERAAIRMPKYLGACQASLQVFGKGVGTCQRQNRNRCIPL
jgi:hypothetical protein